MNEYLSLIAAKLRDNKKIYLLLLVPSFIFIFWLASTYLNKGTITVKTNGPEGSVKVFIRPISQSSEEVVKEGREVSVRLEADKYRVTSVIYSKDQTGEFQELSTSKNIDLKSRDNQKVDINVSKLAEFSSVNLNDPISSLLASKETLYVSSVYGVITTYDFSSTISAKVRKEPAYLNRVAGICPFSNGNSVAVDINGQYYAISNGSASVIDMASGLSLEDLESLEIKPSGFINGTRNLVCKNDKAVFYGSIEFNNDFSKALIKRDSNLLQRLNYVRDNNGDIWQFDSVSKDSFDHDSSSNTFNKDIIRISAKDGQQTTFENGDYLTGLSINASGLGCSYYRTKISCLETGTNKFVELFNHPEGQEITNIALDDNGNIYYSAGGAVWRLNIESNESSIVFNSKLKISPKAMSYSSKFNKLSFVTEKSISSDEEHILRVLSL